jgi:biopolymer transport protein ExbD
MKFPRRAKLLRNPFDMTAYAAVFFLTVLMLMLGSRLYTPGVRIALPAAEELPGTDRPSLTVALDETGRYYFRNQVIEESVLKQEFTNAVSHSSEPLTLVIQADKDVRQESLVRLTLLAREAGLHDALLAVQPRAEAPPERP